MTTRRNVGSRMPAGYVAAIVIASVAIVAALIIGVMYAVTDKSKKCSLTDLQSDDTDNMVYKGGNSLAAVKKHLPVMHTPHQPIALQTQVTAKRVTAPTTQPPMLVQTTASTGAPAPSAPVSKPLPPASNPTEAGANGVAQADRAAKHSAMYASKKQNISVDAALKPAERTSADAVKASFVSTGLHSMVQGGNDGDTLQHTANQAIKHVGNVHNDFTESNFAIFDEEGSKKLDAAMALTGTPRRFHETEEAELLNRKAAMLNNLAISGKVDASIEEVLSLTAPMVATKTALLRAIQSQSNIDRNIIVSTPTRFMYDYKFLGSRMPAIVPTPTPQEFNNPAGVDHMVSQANCGTTKNYEAY